MDVEVAVIGAGVVGCAAALALARRGGSVTLLEAFEAPGLAASGTNSGILHTGFDSLPGELETELILRAATLRDPVLRALSVPVLRCGAVLRPLTEAQRPAVRELAANGRANGVEVTLRDDGTLEVAGEAVTDPVAFTLALAAAAQRHGAEVRTGFEVVSVERAGEGLSIGSASSSGECMAIAFGMISDRASGRTDQSRGSSWSTAVGPAITLPHIVGKTSTPFVPASGTGSRIRSSRSPPGASKTRNSPFRG